MPDHAPSVDSPAHITRSSFETFVVGESNRLAHAACHALAEAVIAGEPSDADSPLVLCGDTGLGKSHLLGAIARRVREARPQLHVAHFTAPDLVNEVIRAIREDRIGDFVERASSEWQLLLVDDLHLVAGKERTQAELQRIFDALQAAGKPIVVACGAPPYDLARLEHCLRSRLCGGLVAQMQAPDEATAREILAGLAQRAGFELPADVRDLIAAHLRSDVRGLQGALRRVAAVAQARAQPLGLALAADALWGFSATGVKYLSQR